MQYNLSPKAYNDLYDLLLKECKGSEQNLYAFLDTLNHEPTELINFHSFKKIARIIRKFVLRVKDEKTHLLFSDFLLKHAKVYFPYHITSIHVQHFKQYLELFEGIPVREPADFQDQRHIIIFLSKKKYSDGWANSLVELINSQILVDKKNQPLKTLKLNEFFGEFIVSKFDCLLPQLERLLVRS